MGAGVEVGALSVVVEDDGDLCRTAVCLAGVRDHGGELGGLAGLDPYGAFAKDQRDGSGQDGEPFPAGVHSEPTAGRPCPWTPRLTEAVRVALEEVAGTFPHLPDELSKVSCTC